jgi:argininosuccinate lyase
LRDEVKIIQHYLKELISIVTQRASKEIDILMPGYTHLQRAQPIRWSHWLLSYGFMFQRDLERLSELAERINCCPLGSGALAGNPFNINRFELSEDLGFKDLCYNSLDATSDRDFIAEFLFFSSLLLVHISKISEDLIIYSTKEFGFVQLSDAYSTGSSLMPQKKNPDSAELLRGKSGRAIGNLTTLLIAMKGLPSTYNKDMQEDKEPLFDSVLTVNRSLQILSGVLSTLKVNQEKMKESLSFDMLATDLAEYLVRKNVPFRETHHIVGAIVKMAEEKKCNISELSLEEYKSFHKSFDEDVKEVWSFEKSVESRSTIGGTGKSSVLKQIEILNKKIE